MLSLPNPGASFILPLGPVFQSLKTKSFYTFLLGITNQPNVVVIAFCIFSCWVINVFCVKPNSTCSVEIFAFIIV